MLPGQQVKVPAASQNFVYLELQNALFGCIYPSLMLDPYGISRADLEACKLFAKHAINGIIIKQSMLWLLVFREEALDALGQIKHHYYNYDRFETY
jgi:hypothetical protein